MTDKQQEEPEAPREGQQEHSGGGPSRGAPLDPEVLSRPTRRRFSAEYKSKRPCTRTVAISTTRATRSSCGPSAASWSQRATKGDCRSIKGAISSVNPIRHGA